MAPRSFAKKPLLARARTTVNLVVGAILVVFLAAGVTGKRGVGAAQPEVTSESILAKIAERRYHEARQLALSGLEATPDGPRAVALRILVGEAYRAEGDPESAIQVFEDVLARGAGRHTSDVCASLARCQLDTGNGEALRAMLGNEGACGPVTLDWQRELLGITEFGDGNVREARKLLVSIVHRQDLTWHYLGRLSFQEGSYEEALRCFEAGFDSNAPDDWYENQIYVAWCLLHLNRIEAARSKLESLRRQFESPESLYLLGQVELRAGNSQRAAVSFRRALELQPRMAEAVFGLANALRRLGQAEPSKKAFDHFRELHEREQASIRKAYALRQSFLADPGAPRALELCRHFLDTGDLESGLSHAWTAVRAGGGSEARLWLARALAQAGRFQSAAVHYRRVIAFPASPKRDRLLAESELRELIDAHARSPETPSTPK